MWIKKALHKVTNIHVAKYNEYYETLILLDRWINIDDHFLFFESLFSLAFMTLYSLGFTPMSWRLLCWLILLYLIIKYRDSSRLGSRLSTTHIHSHSFPTPKQTLLMIYQTHIHTYSSRCLFYISKYLRHFKLSMSKQNSWSVPFLLCN